LSNWDGFRNTVSGGGIAIERTILFLAKLEDAR
jgi:hypothetical protein